MTAPSRLRGKEFFRDCGNLEGLYRFGQENLFYHEAPYFNSDARSRTRVPVRLFDHRVADRSEPGTLQQFDA